MPVVVLHAGEVAAPVRLLVAMDQRSDLAQLFHAIIGVVIFADL